MKKNTVIVSCFCLLGLAQNSSLFGMINTEKVTIEKEKPPVAPIKENVPKLEADFADPFSIPPGLGDDSSSSESLKQILEAFRSSNDKKSYICNNKSKIFSAIKTYRNNWRKTPSFSDPRMIQLLEEMNFEELWDFYNSVISVIKIVRDAKNLQLTTSARLLQVFVLTKMLRDIATKDALTVFFEKQNVFELPAKISELFSKKFASLNNSYRSTCRHYIISCLGILVKCLLGNDIYIADCVLNHSISATMKNYLKEKIHSINLRDIFQAMSFLFRGDGISINRLNSKAILHYFAFALCMYKKLNNDSSDSSSDSYDNILKFHLCQLVGAFNDIRVLDINASPENKQSRISHMTSLRVLIDKYAGSALSDPELTSCFRNILSGKLDSPNFITNYKMNGDFSWLPAALCSLLTIDSVLKSTSNSWSSSSSSVPSNDFPIGDDSDDYYDDEDCFCDMWAPPSFYLSLLADNTEETKSKEDEK
ncbi:hypothetical protein FACS1894122_05610 [Alphaproteobacteria bacterium]|nr:hypothetical protein FACS1894122_05610 [Alphaproteobacteria bacterium]